jgi:hypothetical protein
MSEPLIIILTISFHRLPFISCRHALLKKTKQRWQRDGLSNLKYRVISTYFGKLYTNITVDLLETESRIRLSEENIGCS